MNKPLKNIARFIQLMVYQTIFVGCITAQPVKQTAITTPVESAIPTVPQTMSATEPISITQVPGPTEQPTLETTINLPLETKIFESLTESASPTIHETQGEPVPSGWLAYIGYPLNLEIIRTSGEGRRTVVDRPYAWDPVWSSDGQWIAFGDRGELYIVHPDGSELERLTYSPGHKQCVSWSPDGESIAYSQVIDGTTESAEVDIYLMDLYPRRIRQLTSTQDYNEHCPRISPQGDAIAFTSVDLGTNRWRLNIMDIDGTNTQEIYNDIYISDSAWSPDGKQIVFSAGNEQCQDLYMVNHDGSGLRRITDLPGYEGTPSWSQDGNWIVFQAAEICKHGANGQGFFIVHPDGSGLRDLPLDLPTPLYSPSWAPLPVLESGKTFVITESGSGLKIRSSPSTTGEILQILDTGDKILVVDGPIEADNYLWWSVQAPGSDKYGWVAEIPGWYSAE